MERGRALFREQLVQDLRRGLLDHRKRFGQRLFVAVIQVDVISRSGVCFKADAAAHNVGNGLCLRFNNGFWQTLFAFGVVKHFVCDFVSEDGKFFDLSGPACICFTGAELAKVELSDNAERGDMIHLIGTARLESRSDNEFGGKSACLQVLELSYEDESAESRAG